jgi:putative ABC transport system ATP-binding protein
MWGSSSLQEELMSIPSHPNQEPPPSPSVLHFDPCETRVHQLPARPDVVLPVKRDEPFLSLAIHVEGLKYQVMSGGQPISILNGIDWHVPCGTIQLLMGPSGSGKTTLLSILAGLLSPTEGQVRLLETDITHLSSAQRVKFRLRNIGFIFQDFNLFPALNILENVELKLNLLGIGGRAARQEAAELLDAVGLGDRLRAKTKELSGGQKQRVAIARALAGNPPLIMADEPTASLDAKNGYAVMQRLRDLAKTRGTTVLMVTHDPRILDLADRIADIEDGKLDEEVPQRHSK